MPKDLDDKTILKTKNKVRFTTPDLLCDSIYKLKKKKKNPQEIRRGKRRNIMGWTM